MFVDRTIKMYLNSSPLPLLIYLLISFLLSQSLSVSLTFSLFLFLYLSLLRLHSVFNKREGCVPSVCVGVPYTRVFSYGVIKIPGREPSGFFFSFISRTSSWDCRCRTDRLRSREMHHKTCFALVRVSNSLGICLKLSPLGGPTLESVSTL